MENQNNQQNNSYQDNITQQPVVNQRPVVIDELAGKKDRHATTSLILGILGLAFCWCVFIPCIICIIGLVLGIMSMVKTKQYTGIALAGVITSAIGLTISLMVSVAYIMLI